MPQLKVWENVSATKLRKYVEESTNVTINLIKDNTHGSLKFEFSCGGQGSMFFCEYEDMVKYVRRWKVLEGCKVLVDGIENPEFWEKK